MHVYVLGIFGMDEDTKYQYLVTQVHHSALLFCRKQQGISIALWYILDHKEQEMSFQAES